MTENSNLQKALVQVMNEELWDLEQRAKAMPHIFSREFEEKMQRLMEARRKARAAAQTAPAKEFKPVRVRLFGRMVRRSVVVILTAVLVLATAVVGIAIVKPEIVLMIKEHITHWEITPIQENDESVSSEIVPVRVNPPAGFILIGEELDGIGYRRSFRDERGIEIEYSQKLPEGLSMVIDTEGISSEKTKLNGRDAAIFRHDENSTTIVLEDGEYVFIVSGDDYEATLELAEKISLHS